MQFSIIPITTILGVVVNTMQEIGYSEPHRRGSYLDKPEEYMKKQQVYSRIFFSVYFFFFLDKPVTTKPSGW